MAWEKVKLGDVCKSITDGDHQSLPLSECGIPFIVIANISSNNRIEFEKTRYVPLDYYEKLDEKRKPQKGDVLLTVKGSFGIPVFVANDKPFVFQRDIAILKCGEKVNPKFLFFYMKNKDFYLYTDSIAIGAAQRAITLNALRNTIIRLPQLNVQNRIADILSAYDDLIENNRKQIKLLEEAAQRLYKQWFIDLKFPGYETTKIVDGLPEGWKKEKLVGFADVVMGQSPKSEFYNQEKKGLPFHQGVGSYGTRFVIDDTYSSSVTRIAESGSILFSVRAPVGRLNFTKNKIIIGRGLAAINHKEKYQSFLFYMLKERFFKDDILGNGAIFASISKDELLNQQFVIPNDELLQKFNTIASGIDAKIAAADAQMQLLTQSRDRLLPKLMNGEIEV